MIDSPVMDRRRRLAAAEFFDKFGFAAAFVIGVLGIMGGKWIKLDQWIVTMFAVAMILLYAAIIQLTPQLRLRSDQAGDNVYYLGLLFTLVSLCWALATFTPERGAEDVIGSFGVALWSTIVGLMMRVWFSQMRRDLVDIEDQSRRDLAAASGRLRIELDQVVVQMNDFGRSLQQSVTEAFLQMQSNVSDLASKSQSSLDAISEKAVKSIGTSFAGLDTYSEKLASSATAIVDSASSHAAALSKISEGAAILDGQMVTLAKVASEAERGLNAISKKTSDLQSAQTAMKEAAATSKLVMEDHTRLASQVRQTLTDVTDNLSGAVTRWEVAAGDAGARITSLTTETNQQLEARLSDAGAIHTRVLEAVAQSVQQTVMTLDRHNASIADELTKSRDYTLKVHSALVAMTSDLAQKLQEVVAEHPEPSEGT